METMLAARSRSLPPVPPPADGREVTAADTDPADTAPRLLEDAPVEPPAPALGRRRRDARPPARGEAPRDIPSDATQEVARRPSRRPAPVPEAPQDGVQDAAQAFVARLRSAAAAFAAAAGAETAVVREAVPPARHRQARCRVVLRFADGRETDTTFLGPVSSRTALTRGDFAGQIQRWFADGQQRGAAWLVADEDAPGGRAVDVTAWAARR